MAQKHARLAAAHQFWRPHPLRTPAHQLRTDEAGCVCVSAAKTCYTHTRNALLASMDANKCPAEPAITSQVQHRRLSAHAGISRTAAPL